MLAHSPGPPGGGGTAAPGPMSPSSPGEAAAGSGGGFGGGDLWEPAPLGRWLAEAEQQQQQHHKPTARHSVSGSLGAPGRVTATEVAGNSGGGVLAVPAAGVGEPTRAPVPWRGPPTTANPWRLVYRDRTVSTPGQLVPPFHAAAHTHRSRCPEPIVQNHTLLMPGPACLASAANPALTSSYAAPPPPYRWAGACAGTCSAGCRPTAAPPPSAAPCTASSCWRG